MSTVMFLAWRFVINHAVLGNFLAWWSVSCLLLSRSFMFLFWFTTVMFHHASLQVYYCHRSASCLLHVTFVSYQKIPLILLTGLYLLHGAKISEISQWQECFSELKISNPRISCTVNGVRRSSWKVVWVTKSSYASETSFRWQIFCSCSWQAIDMC